MSVVQENEVSVLLKLLVELKLGQTDVIGFQLTGQRCLRFLIAQSHCLRLQKVSQMCQISLIRRFVALKAAEEVTRVIQRLHCSLHRGSAARSLGITGLGVFRFARRLVFRNQTSLLKICGFVKFCAVGNFVVNWFLFGYFGDGARLEFYLAILAKMQWTELTRKDHIVLLDLFQNSISNSGKDRVHCIFTLLSF